MMIMVFDLGSPWNEYEFGFVVDMVEVDGLYLRTSDMI